MNDEEKWNSGNAPQNDRDTERFGNRRDMNITICIRYM